MDLDTKAQQIRQSLLAETDINIFDIFAALYSYCEPIFNTISRRLEDIDIYRNMEAEITIFQRRLLPPSRNALAPLTTRDLISLITRLYAIENQCQFDLQCYTLLRAIDSYYDGMSARGINLGNFPTITQQLNCSDVLGHVYPKVSSPIHDMIQRLISQSPELRKKYHMSRTGRESGDRLRDYLDNFAYLRVCDGYSIDIGGVDSTIRLSFPEIEECKIAVIPLINQIDQIKRDTSKRDSQDRILLRCTGLVEPKKVAEEVVSILRKLSEQQVTFAVFPEMCVPSEVRTAIVEGLEDNAFPNVKMVVAGSFHEYDSSKDDRFNIAYVFGPDGHELWQQRKLQPYTMMAYEAERIPSFAEFTESNLREDISTAPRVIVVRDMPLGRMVVLICSDVLYNDPYREILLDLGVNFIVVPSMTASLTTAFTSQAQRFARDSQATTIVSNSCAMVREKATRKEETERKISFAFLPDHPPLLWHTCDTPAGPCSNRSCTERFTLQLGSWPDNFVQL